MNTKITGPDPISEYIWDTKYRYKKEDGTGDGTIDDSWRRVARALAAAEDNPGYWRGRFYQALKDYKFLPGGRILAGAGTGRRVTLFNCFVMGDIDDSLDGIFEGLKEGALTMQQGGGVGYDFSTLRPYGTQARRANRMASGPVSFMRIWNAMCQTLVSTGPRRGAMMATLRCDHPDIEIFVNSKRDKHELRNFNISVLVTDEFMQAINDDADWPLVFPDHKLKKKGGDPPRLIKRQWSGYSRPVNCRVFRVVKARTLWEQIVRSSYDSAEPGVLFIDRINQQNNLWYREQIGATNPCGEIPLPAYGACDLGSINLTRFVKDPFSPNARLDLNGIKAIVPVAVRMLDNVIDISRFPLPAQKRQAWNTRRIGLGLTGLADALIMLDLRYGDEQACELAGEVMRTIGHAAYRASIKLARERGPFPYLKRNKYLDGEFIRTLPATIIAGIKKYGIRNSHLIAIAPTGTISLLAGNISSGIEPVFDFEYERYILEEGTRKPCRLSDYAWRLWQQSYQGKPPAKSFVSARELEPEIHLRMQAVMQAYVDNSISKTINVPADYDFAAFNSVYKRAYELGLKSCTVFRPNPVTGEVLHAGETPVSGEHCCNINL